MIEVTDEQLESHDPWLQPYAEHRILAGFLRAEDVVKVQPSCVGWPAEVAARVSALHGAARILPPRSEAGQCRLFPVEEPEALEVLQAASQLLSIGPESPVSYSWIEIRNLIATASIADAIPQGVSVSNSDLRSLAQFSLFGPPPTLQITSGGALYSSSPLNVRGLPGGLQGDRFIAGCQISLPPRPILVGYEQGRFYLLNEYGRVLQALVNNVDRLLCLVHYGLDFAHPLMGVRLFDQKSGAVNHFGRAALSGDAPPLVTDFLDSTLSATYPARTSFFMVLPSFHLHQVQVGPPPSEQLPLDVGISEQPTVQVTPEARGQENVPPVGGELTS